MRSQHPPRVTFALPVVPGGQSGVSGQENHGRAAKKARVPVDTRLASKILTQQVDRPQFIGNS
jgi:hypothetical protein